MGTVTTNTEHEVRNIDIIVSKANEVGNITYANPIFLKLSGHTQGELLEKPHSIIRHPDMPKIIFKCLWDNLKEGKDVYAFIKNLSGDGGFYWVLAHVRVATNPNGSFRNYVSTRKGITDGAKAIIEPLYKQLVKAEGENGDMDLSLRVLKNFLANNGASLDTFNDAMLKINTLKG